MSRASHGPAHSTLHTGHELHSRDHSMQLSTAVHAEVRSSQAHWGESLDPQRYLQHFAVACLRFRADSMQPQQVHAMHQFAEGLCTCLPALVANAVARCPFTGNSQHLRSSETAFCETPNAALQTPVWQGRCYACSHTKIISIIHTAATMHLVHTLPCNTLWYVQMRIDLSAYQQLHALLKVSLLCCSLACFHDVLTYLDQVWRLHVSVEHLAHIVRNELQRSPSGHSFHCDFSSFFQVVQVVKGLSYSLCTDDDAMIGMQQGPLAIHDSC